MKVVLFCGGYGLRMRDGVDDLPKPMATVGNRQLIRHVMRYDAHFGHTDFILAMGDGARTFPSSSWNTECDSQRLRPRRWRGQPRDSRLPADFDAVKDILGELSRTPWDVVLTHQRHDAHQDHRLLGELAPTAFRDHLLLQFEIPKWDGDLGTSRPNVYRPLTAEQVAAKWALLDEHYASQRGQDWWDRETFTALARLRGMECRAPYAVRLPRREDDPQPPGRNGVSDRVGWPR